MKVLVRSQNEEVKIRKCCRRESEIFRDRRIGSTEEMWLVSCAGCGSFADHPSRKEAIHLWNIGVTDKNPPDLEFIARLNKETKALERGKR